MTHSRRSTFLVPVLVALLCVGWTTTSVYAAPKSTKTGASQTKAKSSKSSAKKSEAKKTSAGPAPRSAASKSETAEMPTQRQEASEGATYGDIHYKYKLNTLLGVHVLTGTGWSLGVGAQFGYAPFAGRPIYVGPEVDLALGSPGYMLSTLLGSWYELRIKGAPRLSLSLGALAGITFASNTPGMDDVGATFLLDLALGQDISELATVRGQIRPGIVGRYGAVLLNFNVQFRFE